MKVSFGDIDKAQRLIITLHGYGDNAQNFSALCTEMNLPHSLWWNLQGPDTAPMTGGGKQWYPLFANPSEALHRSRNLISSYINQAEELGFKRSQIYLLGFSQGSYMALHTALYEKERLGGVIALSGYLNQVHRTPKPAQAILETPFFIGHGDQDMVVFPHAFFEVCDILNYFGITKVESHMYPQLGHSINQAVISDMCHFIKGTKH